MFWEIYVNLCSKKGESPNKVAKNLSIASGTVTEWKKGRIPQNATLKKLADYFNVSVDYLLGKEDKKEKTPDVESNVLFLESKNIYMVPLFETVSAGVGVHAENEIVDYVPLYITSAAEASETICLRVSGDSMYPKIENGDIIQVHLQTSVDSGTIAAVLLDGEEGLVKKVFYGSDWIELHSINPMYQPMRFEGSEVERLSVIGAVKKIIKSI